MSKTTNNIQLNISEKQVYTINGNKDNFIKLNPNDMGVITRFNAIIPNLESIEAKYVEALESIVKSNTEDGVDFDFVKFSEILDTVDKDMREVINYIFDYDVCSVCAKDGSLFDLSDGEYRYAVIVETLLNLYEDTIAEEMKKLSERMKKYTDKYTTKDHQRKAINKKGTK